MKRLGLQVIGSVAACAGAVLLVAGGCCWVIYTVCEETAS